MICRGHTTSGLNTQQVQEQKAAVLVITTKTKTTTTTTTTNNKHMSSLKAQRSSLSSEVPERDCIAGTTNSLQPLQMRVPSARA